MRDRARVAIAVLLGGLLGAAAVWFAQPRGDEPRVAIERDRVIAEATIEIENPSHAVRRYTVTLAEGRDAVLRSTSVRVPIEPGTTSRVPVIIDAPRASFVDGTRTFYLRVDDDAGSQSIVALAIAGPAP